VFRIVVKQNSEGMLTLPQYAIPSNMNLRNKSKTVTTSGKRNRFNIQKLEKVLEGELDDVEQLPWTPNPHHEYDLSKGDVFDIAHLVRKYVTSRLISVAE
jgi:hypothetical protein